MNWLPTPDRLEWHYREGAFSCGDLLRHLGAIERFMFAENAVLRPSRYPGTAPCSPQATTEQIDLSADLALSDQGGLAPDHFDIENFAHVRS